MCEQNCNNDDHQRLIDVDMGGIMSALTASEGANMGTGFEPSFGVAESIVSNKMG